MSTPSPHPPRDDTVASAEALQAAQRELDQAIDSEMVGWWSWQQGERLAECSTELRQLFGIDDTHTAADAARLVHTSIVDADSAACRRLEAELITRGHASLTLQIRRPDGALRTIKVLAVALQGPAGRPVATFGVVRDLTDIQIARRHLAAAIHAVDDSTEHLSAPSTDSDTGDEPTTDQLMVVYQPKVSLTTKRIVGLEASVRWMHPVRGVLAPSEFVPLVERSGALGSIDRWAIREACIDGAEWQRAHPGVPLTITLKVSARTLDRALIEATDEAVAESEIDASTLWLAFTETAVMDDLASSTHLSAELTARGVHLALDDFGTGRSALGDLHRLPIEEIKIDRSFIQRLDSHSVDGAIVASMVNLAHAIGCGVVADGVETTRQIDRLTALGCDVALGTLIARPLEPVEVDEYLAADAAGDRWLPPAPWRTSDRIERGVTVLVVDDAADVRLLAKMSLSAAGFTCHEAGSAQAAIALARRLRPDAILLDINLPDMSGIEVCRTLRADATTADCTMVMLTGRSDGVSKAEAFLLGADDYIIKPFAPRELIARVLEAHRRRRTMPSTRSPEHPELDDLLRDAQRQAADDALQPADTERFSSRQLEIMRRLLGGERVPGIASHLYLSQSTVRNHLSAIYRKVGVGSQEELLIHLRSADAPPPGE